MQSHAAAMYTKQHPHGHKKQCMCSSALQVHGNQWVLQRMTAEVMLVCCSCSAADAIALSM
jgi:hypothetical protein